MKKLADAALARLSTVFDEMYSEGGAMLSVLALELAVVRGAVRRSVQQEHGVLLAKRVHGGDLVGVGRKRGEVTGVARR